MLFQLRLIASEGKLAVDPEKHPSLFSQMQIAEHKDDRLQKGPAISYDSLDALRLALLNYELLQG